MIRSEAIRQIEGNIRTMLLTPLEQVPRMDGIPMTKKQIREQMARWLVGLPLLRKELALYGEGS